LYKTPAVLSKFFNRYPMKKITLSLVLFLGSQCVHAQWTLTGNNLYPTVATNNVVIGATAPLVISASSALFPSAIPEMEILSGAAITTPYAELMTMRHSGISVDAVSRQLGFIFKLSNEASLVESSKMGGMVLESSNGYANNPALSFVIGNVRRMTIDYFGNVGIGTTTPKEALSVNGSIRARQVKVEVLNWPDYVFAPDYQLPSLTDVKNYIAQNQHLPDMPSEQEVTQNGLNLGEMNKLLVKKVEELTLYLIEKDKQLTAEQTINKQQGEKLMAIDKRLALLEKQGNQK
jgi:hypothetical protein